MYLYLPSRRYIVGVSEIDIEIDIEIDRDRDRLDSFEVKGRQKLAYR